MGLTSEERAELFETLINSESVEDRAVAITHIQEELNSETENHLQTQQAFNQMQENYNTATESLKQMLNTQTQQTIIKQQQQGGSGDQSHQSPVIEKTGFDLLRG